jgi:hypothetical protein
MKLFPIDVILGDITIYLYRWHSIGIIPSAKTIHTFHNESKGRMYEFGWLGIILSVDIPVSKKKMCWSLGGYGPAWSCRRKKWYWIPKD